MQTARYRPKDVPRIPLTLSEAFQLVQERQPRKASGELLIDLQGWPYRDRQTSQVSDSSASVKGSTPPGDLSIESDVQQEKESPTAAAAAPAAADDDNVSALMDDVPRSAPLRQLPPSHFNVQQHNSARTPQHRTSPRNAPMRSRANPARGKQTAPGGGTLKKAPDSSPRGRIAGAAKEERLRCEERSVTPSSSVKDEETPRKRFPAVPDELPSRPRRNYAFTSSFRSPHQRGIIHPTSSGLRHVPRPPGKLRSPVSRVLSSSTASRQRPGTTRSVTPTTASPQAKNVTASPKHPQTKGRQESQRPSQNIIRRPKLPGQATRQSGRSSQRDQQTRDDQKNPPQTTVNTAATPRGTRTPMTLSPRNALKMPQPKTTSSPSVAQNSTRPPTKNGSQSPAQNGAQSPAQNGAQSPAQNGAQSPAQNGAQSPAQNGAQSPTQSGAQSPAQNGAQSPAQSGAQSPDITKYITMTHNDNGGDDDVLQTLPSIKRHMERLEHQNSAGNATASEDEPLCRGRSDPLELDLLAYEVNAAIEQTWNELQEQQRDALMDDLEDIVSSAAIRRQGTIEVPYEVVSEAEVH